MRWTTYFAAPSEVTGDFQDIVYRSTFAVDPTAEVVQFWFSGDLRQGHRRAATQFRWERCPTGDNRGVRKRRSQRHDLPPPEAADMPTEP
jgi:hypothetical protein